MTASFTGHPLGGRRGRALAGLSLTAVVGALVLGGCASARHPSSAAGPGRAVAPRSTAATSVPVPTGAPTAGAAASAGATVSGGATAAASGPAVSAGGSAHAVAGGATAVCPVTAGTLLAALKADSTGLFRRAGRPTELATPTCYDAFAVAETVPNGVAQTSSVLFGFDATARTWRPLNLGSADFCAGYAPATVAAHLPGCA